MSTPRKNRREFLRTAVLGAAGAALAACAPGPAEPLVVKETVIVSGTPQTKEKLVTAVPAPAEPVTVEVWSLAQTEWQDGPNQQAKAFNEMYASSIELVFNFTPEAGRTEKFNAMFAAGDGPMCWMGRPVPDDYPKYGTVQNLSPFILRDGIKPEELWFDAAWKNDTWHGNIYQVPESVRVCVFYYNQGLFDAAGVPYPKDDWTTDDLLQACLKIRDEEKGTFGTSINGYGGPLWGSGGLAWSMGMQTISKDGRQVKGMLDSPATLEGLQWYLDLQAKHDVSASGDQLKGLGPVAFASNKLGIHNGQANLRRNLEGSGVQYGVVGSPRHKDLPPQAWAFGFPYFMWSGASEQDAIWEVMKYVSGPEGTKIQHLSKSGWASPCPSVWKELGADQDAFMSVFWRELTTKPGQKAFYSRTEYWGKCVVPGLQQIWIEYVDERKRPLETLVATVADEAQACLDDMYATE